MHADMAVPLAHHNKARRDWGNANTVMLEGNLKSVPNWFGVKRIRQKIARFTQTAVYPQQLTLKTEYLGVGAGAHVYKITKGREVGGVQEDGVRAFVLVYEEDRARLIISPLMPSEFDARTWARAHTGAN